MECWEMTLYCAGPQKTVVTSGHSGSAGKAGWGWKVGRLPVGVRIWTCASLLFVTPGASPKVGATCTATPHCKGRKEKCTLFNIQNQKKGKVYSLAFKPERKRKVYAFQQSRLGPPKGSSLEKTFSHDILSLCAQLSVNFRHVSLHVVQYRNMLAHVVGNEQSVHM